MLMFAIVAAVVFGLALLLELIDENLDLVTPTVLLYAGLLFLALHFVAGPTRRRRR